MERFVQTTRIRKFSKSTIPGITILLALVLVVLSASVFQAQTANKRLYLKTGSALNRVVPTGSTVQITDSLKKQAAKISDSGYFKTGNSGSTAGSLSSTATGSAGVSSKANYTPAGTNRLMLVSIGSVKGTNNAVSSVTFGSQSFTKLDSATVNNRKLEFWYLLNPSTTGAAVTINWPVNQTLECMVGVTAFNNVDPQNPFGKPVTNSDAALTTSSLNVPSGSGDIIVDAIAMKDNVVTATSPQHQIFQSGTNSIDVASSYRTAATGSATQTSMQWTGISGGWSTLGVALKGNTNSVAFTESPAMCSPFTIKSGTAITITAYATVNSGTLSGVASVPFYAVLSYDNVTILTLTTATNSGLGAAGTTGTLTWSGTINPDITIPAGKALVADFYNDYTGATVKLRYDATSAISYVSLPTSTFINNDNLAVYNAAYSGGAVITQQSGGVTNYIRTVVSDPFGYSDISGLSLSINGGTPTAVTKVDSLGCKKIFESSWTPAITGTYKLKVTSREGTEGTVTDADSINFLVINSPVSVTKTKISPASGVIQVNDLVTFNIAIKNEGTNPMVTLPLQDIFSGSCFSFIGSNIPPNSIVTDTVKWFNLVAGTSLASGATLNVTVTMRVAGLCDPAQNTARVAGAKDNLNNTAPTMVSAVAVTVDAPPVAVADNY